VGVAVQASKGTVEALSPPSMRKATRIAEEIAESLQQRRPGSWDALQRSSGTDRPNLPPQRRLVEFAAALWTLG
jgi:hypothetical protein